MIHLFNGEKVYLAKRKSAEIKTRYLELLQKDVELIFDEAYGFEWLFKVKSEFSDIHGFAVSISVGKHGFDGLK